MNVCGVQKDQVAWSPSEFCADCCALHLQQLVVPPVRHPLPSAVDLLVQAFIPFADPRDAAQMRALTQSTQDYAAWVDSTSVRLCDVFDHFPSLSARTSTTAGQRAQAEGGEAAAPCERSGGLPVEVFLQVRAGKRVLRHRISPLKQRGGGAVLVRIGWRLLKTFDLEPVGWHGSLMGDRHGLSLRKGALPSHMGIV